jgi:hypothetical protein
MGGREPAGIGAFMEGYDFRYDARWGGPDGRPGFDGG